MKTSAQIATETISKHASIHAAHLTGTNAITLATAAINADRDQTANMFEHQIADIITDRGYPAAAERLLELHHNDPQEIWNTHIGPMLDDIEQRFTTAHEREHTHNH